MQDCPVMQVPQEPPQPSSPQVLPVQLAVQTFTQLVPDLTYPALHLYSHFLTVVQLATSVFGVFIIKPTSSPGHKVEYAGVVPIQLKILAHCPSVLHRWVPRQTPQLPPQPSDPHFLLTQFGTHVFVHFPPTKVKPAQHFIVADGPSTVPSLAQDGGGTLHKPPCKIRFSQHGLVPADKPAPTHFVQTPFCIAKPAQHFTSGVLALPAATHEQAPFMQPLGHK
jgi:hypothetical protein